MKEIILKVLEEVSANRQLNMQSEGARQIVADQLEEKLQPHINHLIEEINQLIALITLMNLLIQFIDIIH